MTRWAKLMCRLTGWKSRGLLTRLQMLLSLMLMLIAMRSLFRPSLQPAKRQWSQTVATVYTVLRTVRCQFSSSGERPNTTPEFIAATCPDQAHARNTSFSTSLVRMLLSATIAVFFWVNIFADSCVYKKRLLSTVSGSSVIHHPQFLLILLHIVDIAYISEISIN